MTGKPVWEVKFAEGLCRGGDILVAPSCWQWVNPNEYIYELLPDKIHVSIISMSVLWDTTKESYSQDNIVNSNDGSSSSEFRSSESSRSSSRYTSESSIYLYHGANARTSESSIDYSLRPKVIKASRSKINKQLRSYMPRPVIRSVEMDEPLEYLTEIRQVVIVFVNVITEETNRKTLVKLVNSAFQFVCKVVGEMQGCVNKTSLFDKDLIFLCIFGLRGDKHELESQIGLRCALKLRQGLIKYKNIRSVTVGVTTGMTYCGVVGHVLRREYTVIGIAVNKAARLMCTYIDKVVCDRESYLLSHLESTHFILQEEKFLKGISNVGPIYEFSEQTSVAEHVLSVNHYPLLGRDSELKLYYRMLEKMIISLEEKNGSDDDYKNIFLIRGEPRMGKTRLLEEIIHITPGRVSVDFISLVPIDNQFPYVLLRYIFNAPLGLTSDSSVQQKQDKLMRHFSPKDYPKLGILNPVFNVNFKISPELQSLKIKGRWKLLKKIIRQLTCSCFSELWVIIIDDAELADDETYSLFTAIAEMKKIFFVIAYGNKLWKDYPIFSKIIDKSVFTELLGLDKRWHAALACQVLDVIAIPIELEKVIQERSSGNPGWIESFLVSLLQSTGAHLKYLKKSEIQEIGLIVPPLNTLERVSDENEFADSTDSTENSLWELYANSFRESLSSASAYELDDPNSYQVCFLTETFILDDADHEATLDTILLKLYDSLTPLDQYLIKCAAVLGEIVDRKMLMKLMHSTPQREIAVCIVKLFELRIIGCAVGDFSRSPGPAMLFKKIRDPTANLKLRCGCAKLEIPEELAGLPEYASCGLMRFKLDMFRETTYRLLTENQKVEFHSKALRYLQQNTRRCDACGGGKFNKLLGKTVLSESGKKKIPELPPSETGLNESEETILKFGQSEGSFESLSDTSWFAMCKPIRKSPTRTFSDVDFTNCECNLTLLTAYTHVMEHCRGIGVKELLLVAILEFIEVCISTYNIPQATKLLEEGDELITSIYNSPEDELIVLPCLQGKIQTLKGRCYLESGLITEAMNCFEETVRIMRYKFPTNTVAIKMKSLYLLKQQKWMLTWMRNFTVGHMDVDEARYNDQFACCLAQMFTVYRLKGMQEHARLAAIWGLNVALESSTDFFVLCTAYANMLITAHNCQMRSIIPYLERDAVNLCTNRGDSIELEEINAVAELYSRIFYSRWLRGMMEKASSIAHNAVRLANVIKSTKLKLMILPRLIQLFIADSRYLDVVSMLRELKIVAEDDVDQSGRTWYYALCVDLLLESGISLVNLREIDQFYQQQSSKIIHLRDVEGPRRLYTCMWLWHIRMGNWETARVWRYRTYKEKNVDEYTVSDAISELKRVEGLIIHYETFKVIEHLQKVVTIVHPRYLLMLAYYNIARSRTQNALKLLRKSRNKAKKIGNKIIYAWANHSEKVWLHSLNEVQLNSWKDHSMRSQLDQSHGIDSSSEKALPYSLPMPNSYFR